MKTEFAGRSRFQACAIAALGLALSRVPIEAHLTTTGLGPIYDGAMHLAASPEDLIPALALALLAGLRGAAWGRRTLFVLPAAWLAGGLLGFGLATANPNALVSVITFLLLGGLVVMDATLSLPTLTTLTALVGLYHGYLDAAGTGWNTAACLVLLGLASAVFVLVALTAAFVVQLKAPWSRIAVRVAGSWIVASGLLLLGWKLRGEH